MLLLFYGGCVLDTEKYYNDYTLIPEVDNNQLIEEIDPYKEFDEICAKLNRTRDALLERANIAEMGEIVESSLGKPIIGTAALDTCYGILFYDRESKKGFVGHAVSSRKLDILGSMINLLPDGENKTIEYLIVSGFRNENRGDFSGVEELMMELERLTPPNINFIPLVDQGNGVNLHKATLSYEFAFDTRNGKFLSDIIFFDETDFNPRFKPKSHRGFRV